MLELREVYVANTSSALNIDHLDGQLEHCSNQQDLLAERLWVKPRAKSLPSLIVNRHVSTMSRLPFFSQGAAHNVVHLGGARIVPIVLVEVDISLSCAAARSNKIETAVQSWKLSLVLKTSHAKVFVHSRINRSLEICSGSDLR